MALFTVSELLFRCVVEAAKRAGVRRFVFSSVIRPILTALTNHGAKIPVEEAVLASDMEFTFLHPAMFFSKLRAELADRSEDRRPGRALVERNPL